MFLAVLSEAPDLIHRWRRFGSSLGLLDCIRRGHQWHGIFSPDADAEGWNPAEDGVSDRFCHHCHRREVRR